MGRLKLTPKFETLCQEYVLVQAWKKSHDYVRAHNWYADVLELDLSNARLPRTLLNLQAQLQQHELTPSAARLVIAPKSAPWEIRGGTWKPKRNVDQSIRPLAHLPIRDQTLATAFMLCLADHVETLQGDPTWPLDKCRERGMVSYGHRLLCDEEQQRLVYRWGNAAYYRGYFEDYQRFIKRPDQVVKKDFGPASNWAIVHADLSQFYDRVRPEALFDKVSRATKGEAEDEFLDAFRRLFAWRWHVEDQDAALSYADAHDPKIDGYDTLGLPQGLAASGFFANLFLIEFDEAVWRTRQVKQKSGWKIVDYCRYVDDLRLVIELPASSPPSLTALKTEVTETLSNVAKQHAPGMQLNRKKTNVLFGTDEASRMLLFSETMATIQKRVSGAIDLSGGDETLTMIEGLFAAEEEESPVGESDPELPGDPFFTAVRDVKDETVARFSANRFKKTFRIMRLLAPKGVDGGAETVQTQTLLDHRAAYFAQRLLWRWIKDPSNVRLLRISLDLNPDPHSVDKVVGLLQPHVLGRASRGHVKRVAEYCAAELFRAGATEVGLCVGPEQLPAKGNPVEVQRRLVPFALAVVSRRDRLPWYLVQQALLLLAAAGEFHLLPVTSTSVRELSDYFKLHRVLRGALHTMDESEIVVFTLAASAFDAGTDAGVQRLASMLNDPLGDRKHETAAKILLEEDLGAGQRVWSLLEEDARSNLRHVFAAHGIGLITDSGKDSVATRTVSVISAMDSNPFQQEFLVLQFILQLLGKPELLHDTLTPWTVSVHADWPSLDSRHEGFLQPQFKIQRNDPAISDTPIYKLPSWVKAPDHWKYSVGQLLRALVVGNLDFTANAAGYRRNSARRYTPFRSHWYRRRYGLFNGRSALGPDWLPLSSWFCALLARLLAWPGFSIEEDETGLSADFDRKELAECVTTRSEFLRSAYGKSSHTPMATQVVRLPPPRVLETTAMTVQPFRVAVVQTVIPQRTWFTTDREIKHPSNRAQARLHLSSALSALGGMLRLRETHLPRISRRLDMLVLPELSVHPEDVDTFLVPFARQHRCIVFAGLIYHRTSPTATPPFVNSGIWLLPSETRTGGLQFQRVEQGKWHLAPMERQQFADVRRWRPCQHLIQLHQPGERNPCWTFTGSICYDATDLALAGDLRNLTDTWLVPALNDGVQRFDTMVAALHFHMFQHVLLCNTGEFGGSTAQAPLEDRHSRTIFHHHGNAQAAITFLELNLDQYSAQHGLDTPPAGVTRHGCGVP